MCWARLLLPDTMEEKTKGVLICMRLCLTQSYGDDVSIGERYYEDEP